MKDEKKFAVYLFLWWALQWTISAFVYAFQNNNDKFFTRFSLATFCYAIYNLLKFKEKQ
jgi:hypothetical protein